LLRLYNDHFKPGSLQLNDKIMSQPANVNDMGIQVNISTLTNPS